MEHNSSNDDALEAFSKRKNEEFAGALAYIVLVLAFGILGNIISVMFYGFKVPRTSTNVIITGLATVDLITCVIFTDEISSIYLTVTFKNKTRCKVMFFMKHSLAIMSGVMLLFVAIDRYRKICRPFAWQFSIKSAKISFLVISFVAMLHSVRDLVIIDVVRVNVTEEVGGKTIEAFYCTHSKDSGLKATSTLFHVIDVVTFIIVIGGCIVLYILISRALWVSRKKIEQSYKGEGSSTDGHQKWHAEVCYTGKTSSSDTNSDNTQNDVVKSTTNPLSVPFNCNKLSHEKLESNADPCNILSGDIVVVKEMDNSLKINSHGEDEHSDSDKTLKFVMFKGDNYRKYNRGKRHHAKSTKQYNAERKVTLMMIVITIVSLISFMPYFFVQLILKQKANSSEQEFNVGIQIALRSILLNNAINPYIIGLFNSKFRQFVKGIFCKCSRRN